MKDIVQKLIRQYYETDIIGKEVMITEDKGKKFIQIFDTLMPLKWALYDTQRNPDLIKAEEILEKRKKLKASQVYSHTKLILHDKAFLEQWNEIYKKTPPTENSPHNYMMEYSLGALYEMEILTPYDYQEASNIFDEQGISIAPQLHPKEPEDPTDGALEE